MVYSELATVLFEMFVVTGILMILGWNYVIYKYFDLSNQYTLTALLFLLWTCHVVTFLCHMMVTSKAKVALNKAAKGFLSIEICFAISGLIQTFYLASHLQPPTMSVILCIMVALLGLQIKAIHKISTEYSYILDLATSLGTIGACISIIGLGWLLLNYCLDLEGELSLIQLIFVGCALPMYFMNASFVVSQQLESIKARMDSQSSIPKSLKSTLDKNVDKTKFFSVKNTNSVTKDKLAPQRNFLIACCALAIIWTGSCFILHS